MYVSAEWWDSYGDDYPELKKICYKNIELNM